MTMARKPALQPIHADSPQWPLVDERAREEIAKRKPKPADVQRAAKIYHLLAEEFPHAHCALQFTNAFELLCATILSAQCTDERVNMVTPELFRHYPTPAKMKDADEEHLRELIRSTGFFNSKAKALLETARILTEQFNGEVPVAIPDLIQLRGTARKTANVVRMHAFGLPGISVDTHYGRITQRLGLTKATDPEKIEFDTAALLPPEWWTHFADAVILHGRKTCQSRKPKCESCRLAELCPSAGQGGTDAAKAKVKSKGKAKGTAKPKSKS
jgi:endonuclease-3